MRRAHGRHTAVHRARIRGCRGGRRGALAAALSLALLVDSSSRATATGTAMADAARREGRVVWLTTHIFGELARPLAAAFKAAHGIEVTIQRATSRQTAERLVQAARSPQGGIDVIDGRSAIPHLKRAGLLAPMPADILRLLPAERIDRDGFWVATNLYFHAIAINTELVAPARQPRALADLLLPEWRGRMAWSGQATLSGAAGFIGAVQRDRGEAAGQAFLGKLAGQQIATFDVPSRQIVDKLIDGQFAIALQVFNHQVAVSAAAGAPVSWLAMEPMTGSVAAIAMTRQAPHPAAARLFVEFVLSHPGQEIFREATYIPALPAVAPKDRALRPEQSKPRTVFFAPEEVETMMPAWQQLRGEVFR